MILKQSTIYNRQFLMVLSSDHVSPATGKTVAVELGKAGAAGGAAAGAVSEVDSSGLPGIYNVSLTVVDTNTVGDLVIHCTASGCDNTDFVDQVQTTIFTDLTISGTGRVSITAPITQNQSVAAFPFLMTTGSPPTPALHQTVSCQRSLGGGGFAPTATPTAIELVAGWYYVPLAAADTNAPLIAFRATAPGANDQDILIPTQP